MNAKPNIPMLKAYIVAAVQAMKNNQDKQPPTKLIETASNGDVYAEPGVTLSYILWLQPSLRPFAIKQLKDNGLPTKPFERKHNAN